MDHYRHIQPMELKLSRIRAGLRQYRVAQELGISPSVLCAYENGQKLVPPRQGQRILAAIARLSLRTGFEGGHDGHA